MLYELRMYRATPGRLSSVEDRLRQVGPLFAKHQFPEPLGQWKVVSGPDMPMYVWMLCWPDSEVRRKCFASLYSDPGWPEFRDRTNGGSEMIQSFNLVFMHETPAHQALQTLHADDPAETDERLHELRVINVLPGSIGPVMQSMIDVDMPALRRAGAKTLGVFDVLSGFDGPSLLQIISWPDANAREKGDTAYANDPLVKDVREQEMAKAQRHFANAGNNWLMRPTDFGVPKLGFTGPPD